MKQNVEPTWKEDQLTTNLNACREIIFDIRYEDITAMCGVPESTMKSYDNNAEYVCPFLKTAKKLADMYCTDIDRLCSYIIIYNEKEVLNMQIEFLNRIGPANVSTCRDKIYSYIQRYIHKKGPEVTEANVYNSISVGLSGIIRSSCKEGKYIIIKEDPEICGNFTKNYNYLMSLCNIPYKKISEICKISEPTLTRLKHGAEPSVSTVIRLADYFGVPIAKLLTPEPQYGLDELKEIIGSTTLKTRLTACYDRIPDKDQDEENEVREKKVSFDEAKELVEAYLEKVK